MENNLETLLPKSPVPRPRALPTSYAVILMDHVPSLTKVCCKQDNRPTLYSWTHQLFSNHRASTLLCQADAGLRFARSTALALQKEHCNNQSATCKPGKFCTAQQANKEPPQVRPQSSSSSPPPPPPPPLLAIILRRTRPGRPPPNGEVRAKSMCFSLSSRTKNEGMSQICLPTRMCR